MAGSAWAPSPTSRIAHHIVIASLPGCHLPGVASAKKEITRWGAVMSKSVRRQREPLSDDEVEFLTQLANGNALARQRRRDRERANKQPPPDPS